MLPSAPKTETEKMWVAKYVHRDTVVSQPGCLHVENVSHSPVNYLKMSIMTFPTLKLKR